MMETALRYMGNSVPRKEDPAGPRLKNLMPAFDEPTTTPAGVVYDPGGYETCILRTLELAGYEDSDVG